MGGEGGQHPTLNQAQTVNQQQGLQLTTNNTDIEHKTGATNIRAQGCYVYPEMSTNIIENQTRIEIMNTAIEAAQAKLREMRDSGIQPIRLNHVEKAKANPKSYKCAVLAKCYECMCEYADGRVDCEIKDCPLYRWMPYKN